MWQTYEKFRKGENTVCLVSVSWKLKLFEYNQLATSSTYGSIEWAQTWIKVFNKVYLFAGLEADGIYRVSGNLATIQKLRFLVDEGQLNSSFYSSCKVVNFPFIYENGL